MLHLQIYECHGNNDELQLEAGFSSVVSCGAAAAVNIALEEVWDAASQASGRMGT